MAKILRVYDPSERSRRLPLIIYEDDCPGLLQFFSTLDYRTDTPLVRGVLYQWFLTHSNAGTLDAAVREALAGPGGINRRSRGQSTASRQGPTVTEPAAPAPRPPVISPPLQPQQSAIVVEQEVSSSPQITDDTLNHLDLLESMFK